MKIEYDIVSTTDISELIENVNKKIKDGWEPIGGLCTLVEPVPKQLADTLGNTIVFRQAMLRRRMWTTPNTELAK